MHLKGYQHQDLRTYLSECDFEVKFSPLKKLYYLLARPVLSSSIRQRMQKRYAGRIKVQPFFIWGDLVNILRRNEMAWERFVEGLYPNGYKTVIVLSHDVETQKGFDFIPDVIELEEKYGFRGSWNIVPYKYQLHKEIIDLIVQTGNEIGIHGYNHDGTLYFSEDRFLRRAIKINQAIETFGAVGFRSPAVHRNLGWLQQLNIIYDASCFDYDPYQPFPGGTGCIWPFIAGKLVELPYTVPQDHVLFYMLQEKDITIWKEKTKWLTANYGMVFTLTHPDYLQEKNHLKMYGEFLEYLREIPNAWHCLPREIAEWYRSLRDSGEVV
jgi:peptidoglycan/xylan/chitin deacetylase (PgdA/CDA1 family)